MVRFSFSPSPRINHSGRRQPPPDYSSRRVQLQVGVLVFLFLTVLMLMTEARKPENWQWMWKLDQADSAQDSAPTAASGGAAGAALQPAGPVDTRAAPAAEVLALPTDPLVTAAAAPPPLDWQDARDDAQLDAALLGGWSTVWERLSAPERELFRAGLQRQRRGELASADQPQRWAELLEGLRRRWEVVQRDAAAALDDPPLPLTPERHQAALAALTALDDRWHAELTALELANQAAPLPAPSAATLAALQQVLDRRAWQAVEDNTVLRASDREAWLRCWEQVDAWPPTGAPATAEPVTFVQLFSQPEAYRGHVVQVTGAVRYAYQTPARDSGSGYYVLWLRPSDGSNAPIVVYTRTVPARFPPLPTRDVGQDGAAVREDVVVTGLFFKRWLYASRDGLRMAPLILGRITDWTPAPAPPPTQPISRVGLAALVVIAAVLGGGCALLVMRSSRRSTSPAHLRTAAAPQLPAFATEDVQPAVPERLRQLADEERDET